MKLFEAIMVKIYEKCAEISVCSQICCFQCLFGNLRELITRYDWFQAFYTIENGCIRLKDAHLLINLTENE